MAFEHKISKKIRKASLSQKKQLNEHVWELTFLFDEDFIFSEGQYVWIRLAEQLRNHPKGDRRAFSISSAPTDKRKIQIIFRANEESDFKRTLLSFSLGDSVEIIGPFGSSFTFVDESRDIVLIGGGVGVAPFMSLIRARAQMGLVSKITLISVYKDKRDALYVDELNQKEQITSNFQFFLVKSRELKKVLKEIEDDRKIFALCGSQGFIDWSSNLLKELKVDKTDIIFEQFYPSSYFLREGFEFYEDPIKEFAEVRQRYIDIAIPVMVFIGLICSVVAGMYYLVSGKQYIFNIVAVYGLLFVLFLWRFFKNKNVLVNVTLAVAMLGLVLPLFFGDGNVTVYWLPFFPVFAFLINPKQGKFWAMFFYVLVVFYIVMVNFGFINSGLGLLGANSLVGSLILLGVTGLVGNQVENKSSETLSRMMRQLFIFRQAVESTSNHVVVSDENGQIVFANKAAENITGFKFSEMVGNTPRIWGSEMSLEFYKSLWKAKSLGKSFDGEVINRKKNGELYTALSHISPIKSDNEEIIGYVATEEDITLIKELEKLKDEFVSLASHELRTPMTAIKGYLSMVLDGDYGKVSDKLREPLVDMQVSTDRLISLVNDMLNISRIEAGRVKYEMAYVDISSVITESTAIFKPLLKERNLKLVVGELPEVKVYVDANKLKQVVSNLLGNALKFTDKGSISIYGKYNKKEQELTVCVEDTGCGISEVDGGDKLFNKFYQVQDPKAGRPPGTGLGLYICRQLVEKMGGNVWLEKSVVGKGSIFAFTVLVKGNPNIPAIEKDIEEEAREHPDQKSLS